MAAWNRPYGPTCASWGAIETPDMRWKAGYHFLSGLCRNRPSVENPTWLRFNTNWLTPPFVG